VRNSSPYFTIEELKKKDDKEKRKKWLQKNGFNSIIGTATSKKIPLRPIYMNLVPFKESPLNYNFRDVNRNKWICEKNFSSL
jgi:hypothetical protein